ncbi:hypothetical protein AMAG_17338 [Allomyces macrogynus ATCC 38327]|uniref:Uncharacterized protein n=1 Tax=Allomyces macrogynus (strain ATCC 38327) TaxID=578462 RepID=A0A0L0TDY9_ALLM3|nr:hypothetical protein AMAG_17338 [Allomyces macrogynus ATCC 38327]|eukprot:KNE73073.1 hypothetical protein AMAG_17338 [Allomyces macrogynus ATCC 38327]
MVHNLRNRAVTPFSAATASATPAPAPDLPPAAGTTRSRRAQGTGRPGTSSRAPPGASASTDKDRSASPFDHTQSQIPFDHAVQRLRDRRDAALLRRYDANAAFWGEQVLAMTGATVDAHALALAYLNQGQPGRALAALGYGSALLNAATDMAQAARVTASATTDHVRASLACRIVAVQALLAMDRLEDALGYADAAQFDTVPVLDPVPLAQGETQRRAVLFTLEAAARIRRNGTMLLAKECLLKALEIDITAYDAFRALTEFKLLTPDEERDWMLKSLFGVPPAGIAAITAASTNRHAVTPGPLTALQHPPANVDAHLCALYAAHLSPPALQLAASLIPTTNPRPTTAIDALQTLAQPDLVCTPLIHHRCAELTLAAGDPQRARDLLDSLLLRDPTRTRSRTQAAGWAVHDAIDPNARRPLPRSTAAGPLTVPGSAGTGSGSRMGVPSVHGVHPAALAAFAIGCYYHVAGRAEDAVEQYMRAIDVCDMYVAAYLGVAKTVEGKVDKAKYLRVMDVLQAARRVAPNSTEVVAALGRVAAAHGDWSLASGYYRRAREGGRGDPAVAAELGWTYLEQHMYDDGARTLLEALALINPHTTSAAVRARIHAGLARACHAIEDRHRTLHHAHEALALTAAGTPTWSHMHVLLASTYESTGDLPTATTHLHRALDADPTNADVHDALERVIKRRHEPQPHRVPKRPREPESDEDVPWTAGAAGPGRIGIAGITFPPPVVDDDDMDTAEFDAARAAAAEAARQAEAAAADEDEDDADGVFNV